MLDDSAERSRVLLQGGKPPLGLKLDTKQVLEAAGKKGLQMHTE